MARTDAAAAAAAAVRRCRRPGRRLAVRGGWAALVFPAIWLIYLAQTARRDRQRTPRAPSRWSATSCSSRFGAPTSSPCRTAVGRPAAARGSGSFVAMVVLTGRSRVADRPRGRVRDVRVHRGADHGRSRSGRGRVAIVAIVAMTLVATFLPAADPVVGRRGRRATCCVTIPLVSLAMFGFFTIIHANRELSAARGRGRPARRRERAHAASPATSTTCSATRSRRSRSRRGWPAALAGRDPERAARRDRRGRGAHAARARRRARRRRRLPRRDARRRAGHAPSEVLRAAGIEARACRAVDRGRPGRAHELFGWVGARGRHQRRPPLPRATTCTITIGPDWLEIVDDGRRRPPPPPATACTGSASASRPPAAP